MKTFLMTLGGLCIAATFLPLLRVEAWWVRVLDFPRGQLFVLLAGATAAFLPRWALGELDDAVFVLLSSGTLVLQGARIFPYTRLARKQVQGARRAPGVKIFIANVFIKNRRAETLLEIVRAADPDLVLFVETDAWWCGQLAVLKKALPHAVERPLDNSYGLALYSRFPLIDPRVEFLVEDDIPSVHAGVRLPNGEVIEFHGLHPRPPVPQEADSSLARDAELLIMAKKLKGAPRPVVVAGDLNDVAWSRTTRLFQQISGLLDPRVGRGLYSTFHARWPFFRWPVDHVFHSRRFTLARLERGPSFGSDHFPVIVELVLEKAPANAPPPAPSAKDKAEADEKIADAGAA